MICMDINLKLYFDDIPNSQETGNKTECETAFVDLFDEAFVDFKEYIKTEVKIQDIKEVI